MFSCTLIQLFKLYDIVIVIVGLVNYNAALLLCLLFFFPQSSRLLFHFHGDFCNTQHVSDMFHHGQ